MQTKLAILKNILRPVCIFQYLFSSPEPQAQVNFPNQNVSVARRFCICRRCRKLFTFLSSSPETLDLFQPNFAQNIIGKRGFKFELDTVIRTVIPARKCFPLNLRHPLAYKQNSLCIQIACRQYNNN